MPYAALSNVTHRLQLGAPLPFNVRDADGALLLLARGQQIDSDDQLERLLTRGALVDLGELQTARDEIMAAPRSALPAMWAECLTQVSRTLMQSGSVDFVTALEIASQPVQALIRRDPDLAIFQVLRRGANDDVVYGVRRSLQTAIASQLVASRLGWDAATTERVFKVALTMNVSMLELQGQLARQVRPPSDEQRAALRTHPMRSVRVLEQAGIADADWLQAVLHHHEVEDGSGYPAGRSDVGEIASLVRRADVYTSKLSSRSTRDALAADVAGRQMFMQDPGNPMTAALVKEFGIYPPGCLVRLASGEVGVVVARGATITAPVVACLTDAAGAALPAPQRRDTKDKAHAVAAVVGESAVAVRLPLERLLDALAE